MSEHQENRDRAERTTVVHRIEISYRTIIAVALTVGGIWLLNLLLPILVVIVVALILVGTLEPAVGWLQRRRLNRSLSIAIVLRVDMPGDDTNDPRMRARDARAERTYARETAGASPEEAAAVATEIANEIREADKAAGKNPTETPLAPGKG